MATPVGVIVGLIVVAFVAARTTLPTATAKTAAPAPVVAPYVLPNLPTTTTAPRESTPRAIPTTTTTSAPAAPTGGASTSIADVTAATPPPVAPAGTGYAFMATNVDGTPARFDPCTPISWTVNLSEAPPGGFDLVKQAIDQYAAATGLQFKYVGTTALMPQTSWGSVASPGFTGWPPLAIAWAKRGESDLLDGKEAGMGGPLWVEGSGNVPKVLVSGRAVIDVDATKGLPVTFGPSSVGGVVLHEIGHALGLAHVSDANQIMYPTITDKPAAFGPGDLAGLERLGKQGGGCLRVPSPPWISA
jgi:hypothetical protein